MTKQRSIVLVSVTVFLVAVATRTIPLYWSYLPFNLDGFQFAAPARYAIQHGHLPFSKQYFQPDKYTFSALLTIASQLSGVSPLRIAQPLIAVIGAVPCLVAVLLARQIALQRGWQIGEARLAAAVAGLVLAVEGIYLGRSAAVTSEGVGIVFVALLVVVFYRALQTNRVSWMLLSVLLVVLLPLTHVLATIEGVLVVTALLALAIRRSQTNAIRFGILFVGFFWIYFGGYYSILEMGMMGRVTTSPGLFVAWVLVLGLFSVWVPTTDTRLQRGLPVAILLIGLGVFVANSFVPVFPGTAETPWLVVFLTVPVAFLGFCGSWGLPYVTATKTDGMIVVALLVGPLALIGFALTGGLTVAYQDIVARGQIFLHLAVVVLAALAVVALGHRSRIGGGYRGKLRAIVIPLLVLGAVVSAPIAFLGLHATPAQPVTSPAEFEATTFATTHIPEPWISDGHISRIASYYYPTRTTASSHPIYQWLYGTAQSPRCTVVSQASWTTVGVQLFPASPAHLSHDTYEQWITTRQVVYATSSTDPIAISSSTGVESTLC